MVQGEILNQRTSFSIFKQTIPIPLFIFVVLFIEKNDANIHLVLPFEKPYFNIFYAQLP